MERFPFTVSWVDRGPTISSVVRGATVIAFFGGGDFPFGIEGFVVRRGVPVEYFYRLDGAKVWLSNDGRQTKAWGYYSHASKNFLHTIRSQGSLKVDSVS